jgi:hypothetical protein
VLRWIVAFTSVPQEDHLRYVSCESVALGGRGDIALFVPPAGG